MHAIERVLVSLGLSRSATQTCQVGSNLGNVTCWFAVFQPRGGCTTHATVLLMRCTAHARGVLRSTPSGGAKPENAILDFSAPGVMLGVPLPDQAEVEGNRCHATLPGPGAQVMHTPICRTLPWGTLEMPEKVGPGCVAHNRLYSPNPGNTAQGSTMSRHTTSWATHLHTRLRSPSHSRHVAVPRRQGCRSGVE